MKIKKGNRYVCIKGVKPYKVFKKGDVYISEKDGYINDDRGWQYKSNDSIDENFIPYSQLDRVYTKHTPLLEKIIGKYEGKKDTTCGDIKFFDNVSLEETGWFVSTSWVGEDYYQERGYTYLSEKAFIEFMDLGKYVGSLNVESEEVDYLNIAEEWSKDGEKEEDEKILKKAKEAQEEMDAINPQKHYDNTHGSLYKIAEKRGWCSYQFDIVKRIDRALKKGQFEEDLKKTKDLIDLWLREYEK